MRTHRYISVVGLGIVTTGMCLLAYLKIRSWELILVAAVQLIATVVEFTDLQRTLDGRTSKSTHLTYGVYGALSTGLLLVLALLIHQVK